MNVEIKDSRTEIESGRNPFPARVGCVEIGTNAIRFIAASLSRPGTFEALETQRAPVRLGHSVFLTGRLTDQAQGQALQALGDFKERSHFHGLTRLRIVATSALRESTNGAEFCERVHEELGWSIDIISGSEEARLAHLAIASVISLGQARWFHADLGGGSVEVSVMDGTGIHWSESHTMGSVRLLEVLADPNDDARSFSRLLAEYVSTLNIPEIVRNQELAGFIATGGNIETVARMVNPSTSKEGLLTVSVDDLRSLIEKLSRLSYRERVDQLGLREDRADVILPAALVYEKLAALVGASTIIVPFVGVREGVILDIGDELAGRGGFEQRIESPILMAARNLGRKYLYDEAHAEQVMTLALSLFDQMQETHGLGSKDRLFLEAAALLHDIGQFISFKRHHKHSYYLIANSELPGLTSEDMVLIATISRYHRKSEPSQGHEPFASLPRADRDRVMKLTAILRVADALDREHKRAVRSIFLKETHGEIRLQLHGDGDLLLEQWGLKQKSQLFKKVFSKTITIERL
ncbi:MAG TPA: Ppx/GppA phosphatase family protein [Thermoanaerobaculia bacterium]|nr:Ppx/GppA phosphatase family protein [Thermoanaerobaculia bacterium]HUM30079.1 Ppx/GppA phosphatase family protein [Thermoanaerobaculia bacterium]HXK69425.1 Ppx/GppA phosphatase family protein [Thermoanaerobaculia bacterium]